MKFLLVIPFLIFSFLSPVPFQTDAYFAAVEKSSEENEAFKKIDVQGKDGSYVVKGEVKTKRGAFFYTVEDGHNQYVDETKITSGTEWTPFEIKVEIEQEELPQNATIVLHLYMKDETGGNVHSLPVVLQRFEG